METTLHRELKRLYAEVPEACEVQLDGFRIDAVADGELIEIQHGSLAAIRRKVEALLSRGHVVKVVKPLPQKKFLVTYPSRGREPLRQRYSPSRGSPLDVFVELVHFMTVFPHPALTIEILMTEQEEHRRLRKPKRRWGKNYRPIDLKLRQIYDRILLKNADDLWQLIDPGELPDWFTSRDLAVAIDAPCWLAQKMTYCLRKAGSIIVAGKKGNAWLYQRREEPAVVVVPSNHRQKKRAA
ncbi:MAG: hypothetical protein O2955_11165 [Planctomycetota bacterium]|nr:hypothetical protein [Planctomycetota bacterium]MDA1213072.1 hypothetical protein [Planctomycetota bacterium]